MAPRILLTAIWAVGTCHRPLSWIAGHSYCPLPLLLMRYNTAAVWFSQPEIVSLMSLSLRAIRAVLDCPTSSLLLWAEDIVSAAPCCQNWHPPVLGSQPIVLSCIRTFSETQLWCSAWSLRRRCSWVRIDRSHWVGHSIYCLGHRLTGRLRFRLCGRPATATIIVYGGCVRTGAFRGPALCAPSSCLLLLCLGISIMIPRVRLWPGDGILLIETPEFITWANHKEPYR